ncbi:MAG: hypothetical protein INF92_06945 [Rhodobacter sp.]|nr:hypothetical protein [Rhodobacter sp.]
MSAEDLISLKSSSLPVKVAAIATVAVFLVVGFLVFGSVKVDEVEIYRWQQFMRLPPNAMADTLSGIGATLTLIWVVASVFQQSLELRAQREEFRKMAEKQGEQSAVLNQISEFASQDQNLELNRARVATLRAFFGQTGPHRGGWYIKEKGREVRSLNGLGAVEIAIEDRAFNPSQSDELFMSLLENGLKNFCRITSDLLDKNYETISYPPNRSTLSDVKRQVVEVIETLSKLPTDVRQNLDIQRWIRVKDCLHQVLDDQRLWTTNGWESTP